MRPATEDGVFFAGDSAGHCLPLTAEGIRTAFYFGIALGRELRAVLEGRQDRARGAGALRRVQRARTAGSSRRCTCAQQSIRHLHGRPLDSARRACSRARAWRTGRFRHYLEIAPPSFAVPGAAGGARAAAQRLAA